MTRLEARIKELENENQGLNEAMKNLKSQKDELDQDVENRVQKPEDEAQTTPVEKAAAAEEVGPVKEDKSLADGVPVQKVALEEKTASVTEATPHDEVTSAEECAATIHEAPIAEEAVHEVETPTCTDETRAVATPGTVRDDTDELAQLEVTIVSLEGKVARKAQEITVVESKLAQKDILLKESCLNIFI